MTQYKETWSFKSCNHLTEKPMGKEITEKKIPNSSSKMKELTRMGSFIFAKAKYTIF